MDIVYDADLSGRNSFGMKVKAACLVEYDDVAELESISRDSSLPRPFLHMGGGSNLLFTKDFSGTVLHSRIRFVEEVPHQDAICLRVGAGVVWDDFCALCAARGLWGPENLSSIPGECGAAAVQNIGAYGREVSELVLNVECYDLQEHTMRTFSRDECRYAYRDSYFKNEGKGRYVVTAVNFMLSREASPCLEYGNLSARLAGEYPEDSGEQGLAYTPEMIRRTIIGVRDEKLPSPSRVGSAGSYFRNPAVGADFFRELQEKCGAPVPHFENPDGSIKVPAAWLIDSCGWKGRREGGAGVWEKQPLVLVNADGNATPGEICRLEEKIRASVLERFGICLEREVEHV